MTRRNGSEDEREFYFDCYGPFELQHSNRKFSGEVAYLKDLLEERDDGLSTAIGCYLFGIKYGPKITPWYVGMTVAAGGFVAEILQPHKRTIYAQSMMEQRGKPVMFLFPLLTAHEYRFSQARSSARRMIQWLEEMLMGLAYARNPDIGNLRAMRFLRNVEVEGLLGPRRQGRPDQETRQIRSVLLGRR